MKQRYNGHVYFVPTTCWQLATWVAARSTPPSSTTDPPGSGAERRFAETYATRYHGPMLWYTPDVPLGDEVYDFLHRLGDITRVFILGENSDQMLRDIDQSNLRAMVAASADTTVRQSDGSERTNVFCFPPREGPAIAADQAVNWPSERWLSLRDTMDESESIGLAQPNRVVLVTPASPLTACAVVPLASYTGGSLLYWNPDQEDDQAVIDLLSDRVMTDQADERFDEVWLVGSACRLREGLRKTIETQRTDKGRFGVKGIVREIPGVNHFDVAEGAALILLTYQYLDSVLRQSLTHPSGREHLFPFLADDEMRGLFHHCNRILDVADQFRQQDYTSLPDLHDLYWSMTAEDRRQFTNCYRKFQSTDEACGDADTMKDSLAVVSDYSLDSASVPHHLIDAAAFAARRQAPLILLRPLPAETTYYIGSLMDKIDDRLTETNKLQGLLLEESIRFTDRQQPAVHANDTEYPEDQRLDALDRIHRELARRRSDLSYHIRKTGEVLYQSLVPIAMRRTLRQLSPRFLAAFIEDPSLPLELIRQPATQDTHGHTSEDELAEANPAEGRIWSLSYAIGHMSGVNYYETNLTSNISYFTPASQIDAGDVRVLLCSNPTQDLPFSGTEAESIEEKFRPDDGASDEAATSEPPGTATTARFRAQRVLHLRPDGSGETDVSPTRENLVNALREGYDIFHYSGHAFFDNVLPGRSGLVLSGEGLTASDVRFMLDFNRSPVVYANACLAGRIKSVSARFTGLATAFIRAGAAGYVSPLWSVDDRKAIDLALTYYELLLQGQPIGECLRRAKSENATTPSSSMTWASYVLYGDPTLVVISNSQS